MPAPATPPLEIALSGLLPAQDLLPTPPMVATGSTLLGQTVLYYWPSVACTRKHCSGIGLSEHLAKNGQQNITFKNEFKRK